jgi:co-chaperonin GroES (HSP10)
VVVGERKAAKKGVGRLAKFGKWESVMEGCGLKEGDRIVMGFGSGFKNEIAGKEYFMCDQDMLEAKVEEDDFGMNEYWPLGDRLLLKPKTKDKNF